MHSHPFVECVDLRDIGIAHGPDGEVLGVIHPEALLEQRYLRLRPDHREVLPFCSNGPNTIRLGRMVPVRPA